MPLHRNRLARISKLALPIIGGMVSQNILNLVDTGMVGSLGDAALAAVGIGSFATFMSQAMVLGISSGVQAIAARRKGEGKEAETAYPLNAGLALVVMVAPLLSLALYYLAPVIFGVLNDDQTVVEPGAAYYQVRIIAITFVGFNFSFRGYWNAIDKSYLYMSTLVIMHASNVLFNYMFIFGHLGAPELGAVGAGVGTTLSTVLGTVTYLVLAGRYARHRGFLRGLGKKGLIKSLAKLSLPSSLQQFFFAAGFVVTFYIIGKIGTAEVAAANVLINVMLVAILPAMAMGLAAATLVGQALGKNNPADAKQWGWDVVKTAVMILGLLGLPMWAWPEAVLAPFIHNPDTLELARLPMQLVGALIALEGIGLVLLNALLGAGDARRVMLVSILTQWLLFLPMAYLVGVTWQQGLLGVWLMQAAYRLLQTVIFVIIWQKEKWVNIRI